MRLRIWSRETGSAVPPRASLLILHTLAESGAKVLIGGHCLQNREKPLIAYLRIDPLSHENTIVYRYGHNTNIAEYGSTGYQSCSLSAEKRKIIISLSPYAPENLVSRDRFSRPVPRQPAHSPYSGRIIWCLLITEFLPMSAAFSSQKRIGTAKSPYGLVVKRKCTALDQL